MHEIREECSINPTYCLPPSPISGHKIMVATSSFCVMFLIRCEVKSTIEVGVRDDIMDKFARGTEPDFIIGVHPTWNFIIETKGETLPRDVTKGGRINSTV